MITSINDENRQAVTAIMRSVLVCLNILLHEKDIEVKLLSMTEENMHSMVNSPDAIISNIFDIVTDDAYANVRETIGDMLEHFTLFKSRLDLVHFLPVNSKDMTNDLIAAIKKCDLEFMQDFNQLLNTLDQNTQNACNDLVTTINNVSAKALNASSVHTYDGNTYCHPEPTDDHHHNHCYAFFSCTIRFKERLNTYKHYIGDMLYNHRPVMLGSAFQRFDLPQAVGHGASNVQWLFNRVKVKVSSSFSNFRALATCRTAQEQQIQRPSQREALIGS